MNRDTAAKLVEAYRQHDLANKLWERLLRSEQYGRGAMALVGVTDGPDITVDIPLSLVIAHVEGKLAEAKKAIVELGGDEP